MNVYEIKVTGWISVQAQSEEDALDKFDEMMRDGCQVSDLRWKTVQVDPSDDDDHD